MFARPLNSSKDGNAAACSDIQENSVLPVFWQQFGEIPFLLHMTMPLCANWCPLRNDLLSLVWKNLTSLHKAQILTPLMNWNPDLNAVGCWSHLQNACILYNLLVLSTQQQSIVECPNWIKVKWHWWVCVCVSWSVMTRICKIYHYNRVSCSSPGHSSRSSLLDAGVFCTLQECCVSGLFWTADTLSILCVTTFQFKCLELTVFSQMALYKCVCVYI